MACDDSSAPVGSLPTACRRTVIAYLDTGSGKTFISVFLIREVAAKMAYKASNAKAPRKCIFFLVSKKGLVPHQLAGVLKQFTDLRVSEHSRDQLNDEVSIPLPGVANPERCLGHDATDSAQSPSETKWVSPISRSSSSMNAIVHEEKTAIQLHHAGILSQNSKINITNSIFEKGSPNRRKQSYAPSLERPPRRYRSVTASSSTQKEMVVTAQITFTTDLRPKLLCWGLSIIVVLISVFLTLFAMHKETYKPSTNAEQDTSSWAFADEEQDTSSWVFADEEINIGPTITVSEFKWDCPPSPHVHATLSEQLWCENIDTVEKAFNTEFIQGVLYGTLPKDAFDAMRLQDAYWEIHTSRIWMKACKKAKCSPELKRFLRGLSKDYKTSAKQTLKTYDIAIDDITPTPTTKDFAGYLQRVDKSYPVEYNAIAADSDVRLWYELALRMKNKGVFRLGSPYTSWVSGILEIGPLVTEAAELLNLPQHFNVTDAKRIYKRTMKHNLEFFRSVTMN